MFIKLPPKKCSHCGSFESESFRRSDRHGRRCLGCGHESSVLNKPGETQAWASDNTVVEEF